jgi:hypothetical protein
MPKGDQQHGLCVLQALRQSDHVAPELVQAALLHDVGKASGGLSLPYRVAIVLLEAFFPRWLVTLSARPYGFGRPFYVHRHHAELGAALCEQAGCPGATVHLVRFHKGEIPPETDEYTRNLLKALRAADDRC